MLDRSNPYFRQVELLVRVLPLLAREPRFALKGGTAINLFVRDMPRLSVDIDLTYLPLQDRAEALAGIAGGLARISHDIERIVPGAAVKPIVGELGLVQRVIVAAGGVTIKIEVSPVLRGSVLPAVATALSGALASQFGFIEVKVLARSELYAGKLVAALDRQHPRDLFDGMMRMHHEGLSSELIDLFVIYLVSSSRPLSEVLAPNALPLQPVFDQQFRGMSLQSCTVEQLERTRVQMIESLRSGVSEEHKDFLLSFKTGEPDWSLLKHPMAAELPAVRWKLANIRRMSAAQRGRALGKLEDVLSR